MVAKISISHKSATEKAYFSDYQNLAIKFFSNNSLSYKNLSLNSTDVSPEIKHQEEVDFYSNEIIRLIELNDFEDGAIGPIHDLFDLLASNKIRVFKESFQRAWLMLARQKHYSSLYSLICASSNVQYELIREQADCLLYAALALNNEDLNDAAIRAIESWQQKHHLNMLKDIRPFETKWLEDYRIEVIEYIEGIDE